MTDWNQEKMLVLMAKRHEYHTAIGRLMLKWSGTEMLLYRVLLHYGQLSDAVGRALLSGTRAKMLMDYLLAIAENTSLSDLRANDLKYVFAQLKTINTMRDRIVHHSNSGFRTQNENYAQLITNADRASRGESNMFMVEIDAEGIDAIIMDLSTIEQHLILHLQQKFVPYREKAEPSTWLYKSPQPALTQGRSRKVGRKQPSPPKPSQE